MGLNERIVLGERRGCRRRDIPTDAAQGEREVKCAASRLVEFTRRLQRLTWRARRGWGMAQAGGGEKGEVGGNSSMFEMAAQTARPQSRPQSPLTTASRRPIPHPLRLFLRWPCFRPTWDPVVTGCPQNYTGILRPLSSTTICRRAQ
jgi:hypothetical protein